jgi:ketosteroid isomerase-like protein
MLLAMVAAMAIVMLAITLPTGDAVGQQKTQASDVEGIEAASRDFIAAISARDIQAMDKLWAHESYVTFMGPLSTTIVVGWDGVRKAWEMRFGQFDRVTISLAESHVQTDGNVAWAVGIERVQLLRKNGETLGFDACHKHLRAARWPLARGVPPSNANIQGGEVACTFLEPRFLRNQMPSDLLSRIREPARSIEPSRSRLASVR